MGAKKQDRALIEEVIAFWTEGSRASGRSHTVREAIGRALRLGREQEQDRIAVLEWRITELVDALAFYADSKNWQSPSSGFQAQYDPRPSPVSADHGIRARKALGRDAN